jgi:hypothetical protein
MRPSFRSPASLASGALSGMVRRAMGTSSDDDNDKAKDADDEAKDSAEDPDTGGDEGDDEGAAGDEAEGRAPVKIEPADKAPSKAVNAAIQKDAAAKRPVSAKPPPTAGLGKSVMLFVFVVGGISLLMLALGNERGQQGTQAPKWNEGQKVDVEITLVSTDRQDLACATGTELKGLHCAFESQSKRWSKGDANDDKKMLKPYSTTTGTNFMAAGVWTDPALSGENLPATRFTIKCKLDVAGKIPRADVRWHADEGWNSVSDWYAGTVSECKMGTIQN